MKAGKNRLVVRLLNPSNDEIDGMTLNVTPHGIKSIPMRVGRFWNPGGLWQSVELLRVSAVSIADVFVDARLDNSTMDAQVQVTNDTNRVVPGSLSVRVAPAAGGPSVLETVQAIRIPVGKGKFDVSLKLSDVHPWSPDNPYLYRLSARIETSVGSDTLCVRSGFREFLFRDGYFRLNGRRLFLRGTHSVGHFPIGQHVPHDPELLRRELIYIKAMGFNMVRWLGRTMFPSQLAFCDELGLMVYQESYASWLWDDSAHMKERFDLSMREMILRDRNHPSLVAWGLLNETRDGPIFRHAVQMLPLIQSLDPSRMVFLNSGRWDRQPAIGSLANPRSADWLHALGTEAPGAAPLVAGPSGTHDISELPGDAHRYLPRPWSSQALSLFRTMGQQGKNVFLSEYGNGSQVDPIRTVRLFEQNGASPDLDDAKLYGSLLTELERDWKRWGLDGLFTSPSEIMDQGLRLHSQQRLIALNAIRSNPKLAGYSLTGLSDQAVEGEGLMTIFRELKPGTLEALTDGLAPLRWCLFPEPVHLYRGGVLKVEAVLTNEDVLAPGDYPVRLRIAGPGGVVFDKAQTIRIPDLKGSPEPPMVFPAFMEEVVITGPPGKYDVTVDFDRGAAARTSQTVFVADTDDLPQPSPSVKVTVWDDQPRLLDWLRSRGLSVSRFDPTQEAGQRECILVAGSPRSLEDAAAWRVLMERVKRGSVAVLLAPEALGSVKEPLSYLPLPGKGKLVESAGRYWGPATTSSSRTRSSRVCLLGR